jgi:hypothetical protein
VRQLLGRGVVGKDDILREFFKEMLAQTWFNKRRNVLLATL